MVTISELLTELAKKMNPTREIEDLQTLSDCYMAMGNVVQGVPEGDEFSLETGEITTSANSDTHYINEGYGWLRFQYLSKKYNFSISYHIGDTITVTNGEDAQTGTDDTILYADTNVTVFTLNGVPYLLGRRADGSILSMELTDDFKVESVKGVTVTDNLTGVMTEYSFPEPMYCYIPDSNGSIGYFPNGTPIVIDSVYPNMFLGSFGKEIFAYNDMTTTGMNMTIDIHKFDKPKKTDGAVWILANEESDSEDDYQDDDSGEIQPGTPISYS